MPRQEDLATLLEMVEAGQVRPVIDHTYPLDETARAIAHVAEGRNRGTTVISVAGEPSTQRSPGRGTGAEAGASGPEADTE
jgi:hypothetical protein